MVTRETWHLVHIITRLELGGAQLATLTQVAQSRFPNGARWLVSGQGEQLDAHAAHLDGVRWHPIPSLVRELVPASDSRAWWALYQTLSGLRRRYSRDKILVHTHSSKAGVLGRTAAAAAGIDRVVHSIHGFGHSHHGTRLQRRAFLHAERAVAGVTDAFTADSRANLTQGQREGILRHKPARFVPCGIPVAAYRKPAVPRAQMRQNLGIARGERAVLGLGCFKPQKDPETFVRVAARVLAAAPRTVFLLAGDGTLRPQVEALIDKLGLHKRVRLLGWRNDVPNLLHAADVLLHTSVWEGLPQAFAQAMAAGLPIVATGVDGAPEAIEHGGNGFLCPPGDSARLAQHVLTLLGDRQLRARLGAAGRQRASAFSEARMLSMLDALYWDLAARCRDA